MCFAPTIQHCSLPVRRPQPFMPPPTSPPDDGAGRCSPHPRDLPENQYSYRPPPQHHPASQPSHPASQPASYPYPTYFPRYALPYTILASADSYSGFTAPSHAVPPSPLLIRHLPIFPDIPCFSSRHSHPYDSPAHCRARPSRAITLPVSPF